MKKGKKFKSNVGFSNVGGDRDLPVSRPGGVLGDEKKMEGKK